MSVIEIENELKKMSDVKRLFVIEIATKLVRGTLNNKPKMSLAEKRRRLELSAEIMLSEYAAGKELTAMTLLDGEDFLDV